MNCQKTHDLCRDLASRNQALPTRLVDVGVSGMNSQVHLCESSSIPMGTPYATLSHSWGSKKFFCLRKENQASLETRIPIPKLRKVFRHAIRLTRSIGIRYIWIDSLCIIQDSEADWTREAAMMSAVYANGACNLSATGFADGARGLFALRQPSLLHPIQVEIGDDIYFEESLAFHRGKYFLVEADAWKEDIEEAPLNQRGWVMQERMISPRSLHFGTKQIFWECREMEACEVFPNGLPRQICRSNAKKFLSGLSSAGPWGHSSSRYPKTRVAAKLSRLQKSRTRWYQLVDAYTKRCLTRGSDKLIAIAGLAAVMRDKLKPRYLAGIWDDNIINQLIWSVPSSETRQRPKAYRCPSWSWASVDSRVEMAHWRTGDDQSTALASISQAEVTPAAHDDLGPIKDGFLIINGHLGVMQLYQSGEFVPRDYKFTTLDCWLNDDISLDALDTEYPLIGKERLQAFNIIEAGAEDLDLVFNLDDKLVCFFMPIAFHRNTGRFAARVVGLLLLPTGTSPGEFRRIGMFAAYLKHSIAKLKGPFGTIGPSHYRSKTEEGIYTICIR
jgi:hypothetical protein